MIAGLLEYSRPMMLEMFGAGRLFNPGPHGRARP
jgi:hypothetical protein